MFDFSDSLQRGLDAAKKAQENREEIQSIINELNEALRSMSEGKVEIVIVRRSETSDELGRLIFFLDKKQDELVLAVRSIAQQGKPARQIARWKQSDSGYPCTIMWGDRQVWCDDRASLQTELGELVSSPVVGEAIVNAMNYQSSEST